MRVLVSIRDKLRYSDRKLVLHLKQSAGLKPVLIASINVWVFDCHCHLQGRFSSSKSTGVYTRAVKRGGEDSSIILQVISNRLCRNLMTSISALTLLFCAAFVTISLVL